MLRVSVCGCECATESGCGWLVGCRKGGSRRGPKEGNVLVEKLLLKKGKIFHQKPAQNKENCNLLIPITPQIPPDWMLMLNGILLLGKHM